MTDPIWQSSSMDQFAEQVREATDLTSSDEASRVARATLTTLAEAISAGEVDKLTLGLPPELQHELSQRSGQARSLDKQGFLDRVGGEIATADFDATEQQVRAVLSTLHGWAPHGEIDDTIDQLPQAIADLFR